jgi:hypothetical protein
MKYSRNNTIFTFVIMTVLSGKTQFQPAAREAQNDLFPDIK